MKKTICEICENGVEIFMEHHHINSRSKGGTNEQHNLATICNQCHKKVHHGLLIIEGRFNSTHGNIIVWRNWNDPSVTGRNDPDVWLYPNAEIHKLLSISQ